MPCAIRGGPWVVAFVAGGLLVDTGCAKRLPPPGGKPDTDPPQVVAMRPDSGSTGISRRPVLSVTFSETMDERTTNDRLLLSPHVRTGRVHWRGKTAEIALADSLAAGRTYTLLVGGRATDARGNNLGRPRVSHFTTADSFPPGTIAGRIEAVGHPPSNLYVWAYRADLGHAPDSTARDHDALAQTDREGRYALPPLEVPSRWRLYAFHDANATLTFEPGIDHLTGHPEEIVLLFTAPRADSVRLRSVDPAAPAEVRGTIADTTGLGGKPLRLVAESDTAAATGQAPGAPAGLGGPPRRSDIAITPPEFVLELAVGRYRLRLYLDRNRNRRLDEGEPVGVAQTVEVRAGDRIAGISLAPPAITP
jgi:hypothetical protein